MFSSLSNSNLKKLIWVFLFINIIILLCQFQIYQKDSHFDFNTLEGFLSLSSGINQIPQILVLSAEKEEDKFKELQEHLEKNQVDLEKVTRILYEPRRDIPLIRCAKAYLTAFRHAQARNYDYVLIMEDDFRFKLKPDQFNYVLNQFQTQIKDWDIVFLAQESGQVKETDYPYLDRLKRSLTGGAFLVHKDYYETMIKIAKISLRGLEKTSEKKYAIDQTWQSYQIKDNWFIFNPVLGQGGFNLCSLAGKDLQNHIKPTPSPESKSQITPTLEPEATLDPNFISQLDKYRSQSQQLFEEENQKALETALKDNMTLDLDDRIKDKLPVPTRFDPDDIQLKLALEEIAKGSYKGSSEKPIMKIPTVTLHPNPKCRKYYQLQMKS